MRWVELALMMSVNGIGFRGIEGVTGIHHTTVIGWLLQVGNQLPEVA